MPRPIDIWYLQRQYVWPFWVRYGDDFPTWEAADHARRKWVERAGWRQRDKLRIRRIIRGSAE